mmetsp:Transcript_56718/g.124347  ORF Transcript_56718/g.124347 Transcript_56718/m.124347 type:complete len:209 (+) Transcript_56718:950-1576(+)
MGSSSDSSTLLWTSATPTSGIHESTCWLGGLESRPTPRSGRRGPRWILRLRFWGWLGLRSLLEWMGNRSCHFWSTPRIPRCLKAPSGTWRSWETPEPTPPSGGPPCSTSTTSAISTTNVCRTAPLGSTRRATPTVGIWRTIRSAGAPVPPSATGRRTSTTILLRSGHWSTAPTRCTPNTRPGTWPTGTSCSTRWILWSILTWTLTPGR